MLQNRFQSVGTDVQPGAIDYHDIVTGAGISNDGRVFGHPLEPLPVTDEKHRRPKVHFPAKDLLQRVLQPRIDLRHLSGGRLKLRFKPYAHAGFLKKIKLLGRCGDCHSQNQHESANRRGVLFI